MNRRNFLRSMPAATLGLAALVSEVIANGMEQSTQDASCWPEDRETFLRHLKDSMVGDDGFGCGGSFIVPPEVAGRLIEMSKTANAAEPPFMMGMR